MSKEKIELHTIATYNNKQYELQDLLNNLIKSNLKLQNRVDKAIKLLERYGVVDKKGNFNAYLDTIELKEVLETLKGSDK